MAALAELEKIWGVGTEKALSLFSKGFRSVKDLREHEAKGKEPVLTSMQKIGLKYFEDLDQKIPRSEAEQISDLVKKTTHDLFKGRNL